MTNRNINITRALIRQEIALREQQKELAMRKAAAARSLITFGTMLGLAVADKITTRRNHR